MCWTLLSAVSQTLGLSASHCPEKHTSEHARDVFDIDIVLRGSMSEEIHTPFPTAWNF